MSQSHYNNENVGLYKTENGATLHAENVISDKVNGYKTFNSIHEAEVWFYMVPGNTLGRLVNALERLISK